MDLSNTPFFKIVKIYKLQSKSEWLTTRLDVSIDATSNTKFPPIGFWNLLS